MLLQFNFKNFKSFRDNTTLDMTATKMTEHNNHLIQIGNENILPVVAIFGANASGKSNVYEAFRYMANNVINSYGYDEDSGKKSKSSFIKPTPFLLDSSSRTAESSFEVFFITSEEYGSRTYNYGFSVDQDGISEEWLNYKSKSPRSAYKRIFYRNSSELDLSGISLKSQENIKVALAKEKLIASLGAILRVQKLKLVRDWFINNEFADFGKPVENFFLSRQLPDGFVESKEIQQKVVNYFSSFDSSIMGFEVEILEDSEDKKSSRIRIDAIHRMVDSDSTATIPLKQESAGTLKMFALFPLLQAVLENGSVLFVDELNARLHPLLVRTFVLTFLNPETNPNHAQLVFTSHDSWQLNNNLLRRDEVWFSEKSEKGFSMLYSLADFVDEDGIKIRKDENYEKNYLLGKYGAIPTVKYIDIFKGESKGG